jgi:hypothetical protein
MERAGNAPHLFSRYADHANEIGNDLPTIWRQLVLMFMPRPVSSTITDQFSYPPSRLLNNSVALVGAA